MSTVALASPPSTVMQWSSPTKPGTLVTETPVSSGVEQAREAATATFTLVGRRAMASLALPEKTVRWAWRRSSA